MKIIDKNIFLMKSYSDQDLNEMANIAKENDCKTIIINRDIVLDADMIDKICRHFDALDIRVSIPIANVVQSTIFDEAETLILKQNFDKLEANKFSALFVEGDDIENYSGYTLEETLLASKKIAEWANHINSASVEGRSLSPLEKFLYAYELVTRFAYQKEDKTIPNSEMDSRNLVKVLNGNKIVCVGYASMLSELCKRIDIPCMTQFVIDKTGENENFNMLNHANCKVFIDDQYYGFRGMFNSDPSRDAYTKVYGQTICHAVMTDDEMQSIFDGKVSVSTELYYASAVNDFVNRVMNAKEMEPNDIFSHRALIGEIDSILIKIFTENAENFEKIKEKSLETKFQEEELETRFFESVYDELYRTAVSPYKKISTNRLERLLLKTYECSYFSIEELFCSLINYGFKYKPDNDMMFELFETYEDVCAEENQTTIQEMCAESVGADPLIMFNALVNVYLARIGDEEKAVSRANRVFENSSKLAASRWNIGCDSGNFFEEEAKRLKEEYGVEPVLA